jgi:hypothetical protein
MEEQFCKHCAYRPDGVRGWAFRTELLYHRGWHLDGKYIETIKQVLAEGTIGNGGFQITIRGSDDADVNMDRLPSPDSLEFPFL